MFAKHRHSLKTFLFTQMTHAAH